MASSAVDIPAHLPARHGVIVGNRQYPKWLIFDCPCQRGHRVMLNLDPGNTPHWRVTKLFPLNLHPSVDEKSAVGHCHYVVSEGRVNWVERTERR